MTSDDEMIACPVCGTKNRAKAFRCRDCGDTLPAGKIDHEQIRLRRYSGHPAHIEPEESYASENSWFHLLSMVVWVCLWIAVLRIAPGFAIVMALVVLPLVFRSARRNRREHVPHKPAVEKVGDVLHSMITAVCIAVSILFCALICFFLICLVEVSGL